MRWWTHVRSWSTAIASWTSRSRTCPSLGEGAFASRYRSPSGLRYVGVHLAADTRTSLVEWVGAMDEPDAPAAVRELAVGALTCLVEGCLEPQPIPDLLME